MSVRRINENGGETFECLFVYFDFDLDLKIFEIHYLNDWLRVLDDSPTERRT